MNIARRIAAILLLLEPSLDANYQAIKTDLSLAIELEG
jgi:hypothetical protein